MASSLVRMATSVGCLIVHPVALGGGLRLFPEPSAPFRLRRVEAISLGAGLVVQVYRS